MDEPIDSTQCNGKENCHNDKKCMTHDLWVKLNDLIFDHLGAVSLKKLVDDQHARHEERKLREKGVVQMLDMRTVISENTMAEKVTPERERAVISA